MRPHNFNNMAFPYKKLNGTVKKFTQEQKDAAAYVGVGALGLIGGFGGKAVKLFKTFGNTAKQYMKGFKKPAANQQTIRPLHRDGKIYDRQAINDAFRARFNPQSQQTIRPPQSPGTNMGRADAQVKMREAYRNLKK